MIQNRLQGRRISGWLGGSTSGVSPLTLEYLSRSLQKVMIFVLNMASTENLQLMNVIKLRS